MLDEGTLLVADEMDAHLHPLLTKHLVSLFNSVVLRQKTDVCQMLDESIHSSQDAFRACMMNAADILNIKLMKCGGIYEAEKINAIAEAHHVSCICLLYTSEVFRTTEKMEKEFAGVKTNDEYQYINAQDQELPSVAKTDRKSVV